MGGKDTSRGQRGTEVIRDCKSAEVLVTGCWGGAKARGRGGFPEVEIHGWPQGSGTWARQGHGDEGGWTGPHWLARLTGRSAPPATAPGQPPRSSVLLVCGRPLAPFAPRRRLGADSGRRGRKASTGLKPACPGHVMANHTTSPGRMGDAPPSQNGISGINQVFNQSTLKKIKNEINPSGISGNSRFKWGLEKLDKNIKRDGK